MLGLIPVPVLSQIGQVYAQEEVTPEPPPAEEPPAEATPEPVVDITADPIFELPPTQAPEEEPVEPTVEPVVDIVATPVFELPPTEPAEVVPAEAPAPTVEEAVVVAEVVAALAEVDFVITNEAGETVPACEHRSIGNSR